MNELISNAVLNTPQIYCAYIDPGTGSMLFTVLIGLISVVVYGFRSFRLKLKLSFNKNINKNAEIILLNLFAMNLRKEKKKYII